VQQIRKADISITETSSPQIKATRISHKIEKTFSKHVLNAKTFFRNVSLREGRSPMSRSGEAMKKKRKITMINFYDINLPASASFDISAISASTSFSS
jgi:hypothetical protein